MNSKIKNLACASLIAIATGLLSLASFPLAHGQTDSPVAAISASELRAQALAALSRGEPKAAIEAADQMLKQTGVDARSIRLAADVYLRAGAVDKAVKQFDRYVEMEPQTLAEMWQRGIALFFDGQFDRAAKQFEEHRRVNPHDVENAAWHYLCVAKSDSTESAKQQLLAAPNDPRPPMAEILKMLQTGNMDLVSARVSEFTVGSPERQDSQFYADLYLGLYADAQGETLKAHRFMTRAAEKAPRHYMGDVARVYAAQLEKRTSE